MYRQPDAWVRERLCQHHEGRQLHIVTRKCFSGPGHSQATILDQEGCVACCKREAEALPVLLALAGVEEPGLYMMVVTLCSSRAIHKKRTLAGKQVFFWMPPLPTRY